MRYFASPSLLLFFDAKAFFMETFLAPAKINICLHVLNRRADGYHDLAMLMQRVSLYDKISMSLTADIDIQVNCGGVKLPVGQQNIAASAAQALFDRAGIRQGLEIVIEKKYSGGCWVGWWFFGCSHCFDGAQSNAESWFFS